VGSYSKRNWVGMAAIFLFLIVYGGYFS